MCPLLNTRGRGSTVVTPAAGRMRPALFDKGCKALGTNAESPEERSALESMVRKRLDDLPPVDNNRFIARGDSSPTLNDVVPSRLATTRVRYP